MTEPQSDCITLGTPSKVELVGQDLIRNIFQLTPCMGGWLSDLLKMGFTVETIKKLGRWRSNAVYAYLKF